MSAGGDSSANTKLGQIVADRFRLDRLLGEGGMGAVYQAATRDGGAVAIKMLHDEMASSEQVVRRFVEEGRVCQRLSHPGILRVTEFGTHGSIPFLVMELLQGKSLIEYTEAGQRLPANFAVTVCAGVLHALDYAHAEGIVHRDLKPENVFLVPGPDGNYHTKLLDFGIAKCIDAAGGARRKTATGVLLGTPGYMSPEQVKGARTVDHRADLWAIGVMFYEMVTGLNPFPSDGDDPNNVWGLISAVLTKDPRPLAQIDPHLAPFDPWMKRALSKDVNLRWASAREMSEDLLRTARGEQAAPPVHASQPAGPYTMERRNVPIHSQGELSQIPSVQGTSRAIVHTPFSGDVAPGANSTVPTGGGAFANVPAIMQATAPADPAHQVYGAYPNPNQQAALAATAAVPQMSATAPMPPTPMMTPMTPAVGTPPVHSPRHGTSPSGFAPKEPHRPSGPSPLIPPSPHAEAHGGGGWGVVPWIVLGILILGALGGLLLWALS